MDIYSPYAQKPQNFRKNQPKDTKGPEKHKKLKKFPDQKELNKPKKEGIVSKNNKVVLTGSSIEYNIRDNSMRSEQDAAKQNIVASFLDHLKNKFVDRMRKFFDYEDRYDERLSNKTWID